MSVAENERVIRDMYEALNQGDIEGFYDYYSDEVSIKEPMAGEIEGKEELREFNDGVFAAFPDFQIEVQRVFGEGDWVCNEHVGRGTHKGPIRTPDGQEIPPTGNEFEIRQVEVAKIRDGEVVEAHFYFDQATLMAQLGMTP